MCISTCRSAQSRETYPWRKAWKNGAPIEWLTTHDRAPPFAAAAASSSALSLLKVPPLTGDLSTACSARSSLQSYGTPRQTEPG